jgi:hypothetical protein
VKNKIGSETKNEIRSKETTNKTKNNSGNLPELKEKP